MHARPSRLVLSIALAVVTCACDHERVEGPTALPKPIVAPNVLPPVPRISISVGEVIRATISREDPVCDPVHWDANSPCKVYSLVAPMSGLLTVTLTTATPGTDPNAIDMIVTTPTGATFYSGGGALQQLSAGVQAGVAYEIRINSYPYLLPLPGALDFELRTEIQR